MKIIIYLMVCILMAGISFADITGSESVVITAPSPVNPGASFNVNVEAVDVSGKWGASVSIDILGGCTMNGNTELNLVLVSDLPNPLIYSAIARSTEGTCDFEYDYAFGEEPVSSKQTTQIIVGDPSCLADWGCGIWSSWSDSANSCGTRTRTCSDDNNCPGNADYTDTETDACPDCAYSTWTPTTCPVSCTQTRTVTSGTGCTDTSQDCTGGDCETPIEKCEFWEKKDKETDECVLNTGLFIMLGIGLVIYKVAFG